MDRMGTGRFIPNQFEKRVNIGLIISLVLLLPIVGGLLTYFLKHAYLSVGAVALAFLISISLILTVDTQVVFEWLPGYQISIYLDGIASILISLVLFISFLVHLFSVTYMKEESGSNRYFAKLGLFTFSMLGLLVADHLILLFVFWELVGLSSYLLIGYWYKKEGVPQSARLAFMVNRVADVTLLMGILILNSKGSLTVSEMNRSMLFLPSILIAIGAFGKSAQLPFSGWLAKAMVGPTPVSALIHAATMVAAGVYLLFRVAPFLHQDTLLVIALVGSLTALYGALSALFQNDIKKVLAYSTISQLGYMFIGIGVGAGEASFFHLITHAFFKAGLFLGAGSIIYFIHLTTEKDAQDMRYMGGLRHRLPWTFRSFVVCSLALAGVPFLSGFMSKEGIIIGGWQWAESVGTWGYIVPDMALITALITALYVGRMLLLVFFGENRLNIGLKEWSESRFMKIPLILLAIGSFWIFFNWNPFAHHTWIDQILPIESSEAAPWIGRIVMLLSLIMTIAGLVLAFSFFKPGSAYSRNFRHVESRFKIAQNGFYLISIYQSFGMVVYALADALHRIDKKVVDGIIHYLGVGTVVVAKVISLIDRFFVDGPVNFFGYTSAFVGKRLAGLSSRNLQTQLSWLLVFVILILSWILFF